MNHRPFCLLGAGVVLAIAVVMGNPFLPCAQQQAKELPASGMGPAPVVATPAMAPSPGAVVPASLAVPNDVLDPDQVGPCPEAGLPAVARQGIDVDGAPTWWHADGSVTKRVSQVRDGIAVPVVVRRPADSPLNGDSEDETPRER